MMQEAPNQWRAVVDAEVAEKLERELAAAHKVLMVCDGAMMGKVNPKSVAFKMVNAILRPENDNARIALNPEITMLTGGGDVNLLNDGKRRFLMVDLDVKSPENS